MSAVLTKIALKFVIVGIGVGNLGTWGTITSIEQTGIGVGMREHAVVGIGVGVGTLTVVE